MATFSSSKTSIMEPAGPDHDRAPSGWPDLGRVGVEGGHHLEAPGREAAVAGQGLAQVAGADDGDPAVLGEPELPVDLAEQVGDVVADAPGPVRAQVGEVLADLGGVDAGPGGQGLGGDRHGAVPGGLVERPQVQRQPGDGRFGYPPGRSHGRNATGGSRSYALGRLEPAPRRRAVRPSRAAAGAPRQLTASSP